LQKLRQYISSDSSQFQPDLTELPEKVAEWASIVNLLGDFLPDKRGTDVLDRLLLHALSDDWQTAAEIIVNADTNAPTGHIFGDHWPWYRLVEMSDLHQAVPGCMGWAKTPMIETEFAGGVPYGAIRFRLTSLGKRAKAGQINVSRYLPCFRWVGGRLITNKSMREWQ
jgi:hypothetical protein